MEMIIRYIIVITLCSSTLANTNRLYSIHTMLDQRQRRWADVIGAYML